MLGNLQDWWCFISLQTGKRIHRHHWKFLSAILDVLSKANDIAVIQNQKEVRKNINNIVTIVHKEKIFDTNELCESAFEWIYNCENIFDINKLQGHGQIRLFDYLAERYFSFWIKKNTNYKINPFVYLDPNVNGKSTIIQ